MNKKLFNKEIEKNCDICKFGKLSADKQSVLCEKKGILGRNDSCRKFRYDATKREPKVARKLQEFTEDDFKL